MRLNQALKRPARVPSSLQRFFLKFIAIRHGGRSRERPVIVRAWPYHYGIFMALSSLGPLTLACFICHRLGCHQILLTKGMSLQPLLLIAGGVMGLTYGWGRLTTTFNVRKALEKWIRAFLFLCTSFAILITLFIVLSMLFESLKFFQHVPMAEFFFSSEWAPLSASQGGGQAKFGALSLFTGTFLIAGIAMLIAMPLGVMSAIYLSQYASAPTRRICKPSLEVLAGIPTVVYGFFAIVMVSPLLQALGECLGLDIASESALGAGIVMGIMILPFMSSLSDDILSAVPQALKNGSLALGSTLSETIRQVILPSAFPGIVGAGLLAISRAIGETMLVVMALSLSANLTLNPLQPVTAVTVQIVNLLTGDQDAGSVAPLSAFALGLSLFMITLFLNMIALWTVNAHRRKYDDT